MMNRRKLFGFLATAPIATIIAARASEATLTGSGAMEAHTLSVAELPRHVTPVGFLIDETFLEPVDPFATYSSVRAVMRRRIYDGEKFVAFDSAEGTAVMNRVLQGSAKLAA